MMSLNAQSENIRDQAIISLLKGESAFVDALAKARPDWKAVLERAVGEGIFYPAYRNLLLLETRTRQIPDQLRESFKKTYYLHISKSTDFRDRVERVLDRMESLRIQILLFKGPAIDHFIYEEFLRPRLDLDIAVKDEQRPSLETALLDLGYAFPGNRDDYPIPEYVNSSLFFHGSASLVPIHIHKHLINNMYLSVDNALSMDMDEVWRQTERFKDYRYIFVLKPELNIIYLCEHGLKHDFDQMIYLYEIERLIRCYGERFDWKKLMLLTEGFDLGRIVYYGLYFAKELFSAEVPEEVMDGLKPGKFAAGEKMFIRNTLAQKHRRYSAYPVYLALRRGLLRKTFFVLRTVFPPGFTVRSFFIRIARLILH